jgi:hypothetical protein
MVMGICKLVLYTLFIFCSFASAQQLVGKMYTTEEIDILYGPVISSVKVSSSVLIQAVLKSDRYIMFRFSNGNLIITDDHRNVLYPSNGVAGNGDVFRYFSKEMVQNVTTMGNDVNIRIELRKDYIITLTNGRSTLEAANLCPPYCFSE